MQYLTYLVFGESIFTLIIQIFAVTVLSNLALRAIFLGKSFRNGKGIPNTLLIYLLTELVLATLSVPYYVYVIFWWRPGEGMLVGQLEREYGLAALALGSKKFCEGKNCGKIHRRE